MKNERKLCRELTEELKGVTCQFRVYGDSTRVHLEAEPKEIRYDDTFDTIRIRLKDKRNVRSDIEIQAPVTIDKKDDAEALRYILYDNQGNKCILFGYRRS